ncbi:NUDIX hydrolase [Oceanisphaera avium]|uniref:NUDIX hydrolase n=1 Tax=Oceanisphaera avium TaxID=1903694 RepID=A0A1Y0D0H7_9GAMM|nr:NUDIX hydrolase [Oceanisphaera avium]ART80637.1 NUDIX hydrolase [Oceanisphaera avium]
MASLVQPNPQPKVGVIAIVWQQEQVLLVKRKFAPHAGHWGFPGGKLEWGETMSQGAARELLEETAVQAKMDHPFACFDVLENAKDGQLAHHYVMVAVRGEYISGQAQAADDAEAVGWFSLDSLPSPLCPDLVEILQRARHA